MPQEATEAVQLPELPTGNAPAQNAQRAKSLPLASVDVTQGDATLAVAAWIARLRAALTLPAGTSLLHAQPSSLAQTHTRHKEAAGHWEAGLVRVPRRLWGYGHLALKALLHVIEWVTDSPVKFVIAAAFLVACWFWL
jgi:hypothetical protein